MLITTAAEVVVEANPTVQALFGRGRDELLGLAIVDLLLPLTVRASVAGEVRRDGRWSGDVGFVAGDGSPGVAEWLLPPNGDGTP